MKARKRCKTSQNGSKWSWRMFLSQNAITQGGQSTCKVQWQKQNLSTVNGHAHATNMSQAVWLRVSTSAPPKQGQQKHAQQEQPKKNNQEERRRTTARGSREEQQEEQERQKRPPPKTTTTKNDHHQKRPPPKTTTTTTTIIITTTNTPTNDEDNDAHHNDRPGSIAAGSNLLQLPLVDHAGSRECRSESLSEMFKQTEINRDRPCPALQLWTCHRPAWLASR